MLIYVNFAKFLAFILSFLMLFNLNKVVESETSLFVMAVLKGIVYLVAASFSLLVLRFGGFLINATKHKLYIFYICICCFSVTWSLSVPNTLSAIVGIVSVFMFLLAISKMSDTEGILSSIVKAAELIVVLSVLYSFKSELAYDYLQGVERLSGVTDGPHGLARAAAVVIIYYFFYWGSIQNVFRKFYVLFISALCFYSIVAADSRQVLFALFVPLVVFYSLKIYSSKNLRLIDYFVFTLFLTFTVVLISFFLLSSTDSSLLDKFSRTDNSEIYTLTGRTVIWQYAMELIELKPYLGYGFGVGGDVLSEYFETDYGWTTFSAHNFLLHAILDIGIFGAIILTTWFFKSLFYSIKYQSDFSISILVFSLFVMLIERIIAGTMGFLYFVIMFTVIVGKRSLSR